jgi:hypothetical protein
MLKQRARTTNQNSKTTISSPCTYASSSWTNATPPGRVHANHLKKQSGFISSAFTGQTGHPHRSDRRTRSPNTWEQHRSDRCPSPIRPMPPGKLPELKNSSKPPGNLLNACTEPCSYFYIWDFSLVGIMQRFSTQSKLNVAHMAWEHIFQAFYISFSNS